MTDYKHIDDVVETTYQTIPSKRKATLGAVVLIAGTLAMSPGCANLDQRTAAFDRSEPVYGMSYWNPTKREPDWTHDEVGSLDSVFSFYGESNRPSLTGGNATLVRPTNYLMWAPRFFTRGAEYLLWDCIAPIQAEDAWYMKALKGTANLFGALFGLIDRSLQAVGSNTFGDQTTRGLTPGAYEIEHPDDDAMQNAHRAYDLGKSAAVLGGIGGVAVGGSDSSNPFGGGSSSDSGSPRVGGGQSGGNGAN